MARKFTFCVVVLSVMSVHFSQSQCPADQEKDFSYKGANGPSNWGGQCNTGNKQSPIDIPKSVSKAFKGKLAYFSYNIPVKGQIVNNGNTVQITPNDGETRAIMIQSSIYKLEQFHFHFGDGSKKSKGSEHTINGRGFAMEMHLVHRKNNDQMAVIGVLFEETSTYNKKLLSLIDAVNEVQYNEDEAPLPKPIDLNAILPKCVDTYYKYIGSLTTPPCTENVIWIVLKDPVPISTKQLKAFRKQISVTEDEAAEGSCSLANNYRPIQPLNGRKVTLTNPRCILI